MSNESPASLCTEIEALKHAYTALNRGDVDGFVAMFDPQIERVEFPDLPQGGSYCGLDAVKTHVAQGRGGWAEGACEPQRFRVAQNNVIVDVRVRVRLLSEKTWREGNVTDVFTFRAGKVIQFRSFTSERQALEWIDATASDT